MSTPSSSEAQGIVFVFTQVEPDVPPKEFDDWVDEQNERTLSLVPQVLSARRFKATDGQTPEWLGVYDVTSTKVAESPEYIRLNTAIQEAGNIPRISIHQRHVYTILRERMVKPTALPAKYILVVGWSVPAHLDDEFNKWYDEEHMGDVEKVPGFIRGRRYKLLESQSTPPGPGSFPYNHLIVFEWEDDKYWEIIMQAERSPRTKEMVGAGDGLTVKRYKLYRDSGSR